MSGALATTETLSTVAQTERDRVLLEHLPQVRYIARRVHDRLPQNVPLEDLVHAGILGLIAAFERYDPAKNVQLKSYAKLRIQGAILDSLRDQDWSPRTLRRRSRQIERAHHNLRTRLGRNPSEAEVAGELGIGLTKLQHLLGELHGLDVSSLQDTASGGGGADYELWSRVPNAPEEDPSYLCLRSELTQLLSRAIAELPPRKRQVLALYYYEEITMKEIGTLLGVGESRVSQIHSAAMVRLRARMRQLLESRPRQKPDFGSKPSAPPETRAVL